MSRQSCKLQSDPGDSGANPPLTPPSNPPSNVPPPPVLPSVPSIAASADIASLTARDILAANNQVVGQVASMYQHLGLFITIIVTLVGGIATLMSFLARRSVHEFIQEWTRKLEYIEKDLKDSRDRIHDAVEEAEASATKAAGHEHSLGDSKKVLAETLREVDRLRTGVASLSAQVQQTPAAPANVAQAAAPEAPEAAGAEVVPEPSAANEDAEVAARLKGKIVASG